MNYQLYLGDCLEVLRGMADKSVDAVVTDPPYGIGFKYGMEKEVADNPQDYWRWLAPIVDECRRVARPGAFMAWWQAQANFRHFWDWFGDDIRIYCSAKNFVQLRKIPINYGYEPVVMWYQPGQILKPDKQKRSVDFFVANSAGVISDKTRIEKAHPCPRQLDAVQTIVENFTLPGGTILDPFMGSGTTGVACLKTGRNFIGIEISEEYFKIAQRRIEQAAM